ncbi:hypothetical protein HDV00_011198 [Rhizophlyctis rosea]|nr:hypothetical protein HDV00_011198 [Rhizophlyctis rosea]
MSGAAFRTGRTTLSSTISLQPRQRIPGQHRSSSVHALYSLYTNLLDFLHITSRSFSSPAKLVDAPAPTAPTNDRALTHISGRWSKVEEALLAIGLERIGHQWTRIQYHYLPHRLARTIQEKQQGLDPTYRHGKFTVQEEIVFLQTLVDVGSYDTDAIHANLKQRIYHSIRPKWDDNLRPAMHRILREKDPSCTIHWQHKKEGFTPDEMRALKQMLSDRQRHLETSNDPFYPSPPNTWTPTLDARLIQLVAQLGTCWVEIAKDFPGIRSVHLRNRWRRLTIRTCRDTMGLKEDEKGEGKDEGNRTRLRWTPEEDALLIDGMKRYHLALNRLVLIQRTLPHRHPTAIAVRWDTLVREGKAEDPDHIPWTVSEIATLIKAVQEIGEDDFARVTEQYFPDKTVEEVRGVWEGKVKPLVGVFPVRDEGLVWKGRKKYITVEEDRRMEEVKEARERRREERIRARQEKMALKKVGKEVEEGKKGGKAKAVKGRVVVKKEEGKKKKMGRPVGSGKKGKVRLVI